MLRYEKLLGFHPMAEDGVVTEQPASPNGAKALHQHNRKTQNDGPSGKKQHDGQHKDPQIIQIEEPQQANPMKLQHGGQI